mgnify:CR=1 FL=1
MKFQKVRPYHQEGDQALLFCLAIYKKSTEYLTKDSSISSYKLKEKLIKDGIKENKCELCGVSIWQGILLPLELHHKDGNHYNNDFDNLQILCPNCHSIQEGNSGANAGKYSKIN